MADHLIPTAALHRWMVDFWRSAGSQEREAALAADHLVGANLAGHDSHGVGMAPRYLQSLLEGDLRLNQEVEIAADAGGILTVDGRRGLGQSVAFQAMEIAIERARQKGVCVMGLRNAHHIGRVGHWAEQAVAAGFVSIHFTNAVSAPPMVAPYGGAQARFLTNPFTVGIPRKGGDPILLDFATSAIAQGKVRVAYNRKEKVTHGFLIDAQGRPTDDPSVLFLPEEGPRGALVSFAAHKGYALAMVCELLAAALTGGPTTRPGYLTMKHAIWNNMLAIVFDPEKLGPGGAFEEEARSFIDWVRSAALSGATEGILMPGDPERRSRIARADAVPIDERTLAELDQASALLAGERGNSPGPLSELER
ncbi:MAG TPA: malate/lactate/ureidoglycolate dehydrogenase [Myxococcales bacterium]|nr:malate/lactate/ureidoglycolate dehydrogenase [Myxococcales bacterium]